MLNKMAKKQRKNPTIKTNKLKNKKLKKPVINYLTIIID